MQQACDCEGSVWTGLEAANERRFADAERFFQIVLKEDSNSASAWSNIGNVHLSRGRPIEALSDFSHAIELAPDVCGVSLGNVHKAVLQPGLCMLVLVPDTGCADPLSVHHAALPCHVRDNVLISWQAPVPYLNRALAKEQLGVDAEGAGSRAQAADFYKDAIHVSSCCPCLGTRM